MKAFPAARLMAAPWSLIKTFLRWWGKQLMLFLPGWAVASESGRQARRRVVVDNDRLIFLTRTGDRWQDAGTADPAGGDLREAARLAFDDVESDADSMAVELCLPHGMALIAPAALPLAAENDLYAILINRLPVITPYTPQNAYFDYRIVERDVQENKLRVELVLVRRSDIDELNETLGGAGLAVNAIRVPDADGRPLEGIDLQRHRAGAAGTRPAGRAPALAVFILLCSVLFMPAIWQAVTAARLDSEVADLRAEAEQIISLRQRLSERAADSSFLAEKRRENPLAIAVLDELTRALPDDTWLVKLTLSGREVSIQGYSENAPALLSRLEESSMFTNARFSSAVTRSARLEQQQFIIDVDIALGAEAAP